MCIYMYICLCVCIYMNVFAYGASQVDQTVRNPPAMWDTWVQSLGQEDPLEKEMAAHSSTLDWKSHGQKSLVGYSP